MALTVNMAHQAQDPDIILPNPRPDDGHRKTQGTSGGESSTAVIKLSTLKPGELALRTKPAAPPPLPFGDAARRTRALVPPADPEIPGMSPHQRGRITNRLRIHEANHAGDQYAFDVNMEEFKGAMTVCVQALDMEHQANLLRVASKKGDKTAGKRLAKLQTQIEALWDQGTGRLIGSLGISHALWQKGVRRGAVFYSVRVILPGLIGTLTAGISLIPLSDDVAKHMAGVVLGYVSQLVTLGVVVPVVFATCVIVGVTGFDKSGTWFTNLAKLLKTPMLRDLGPRIQNVMTESGRAQGALRAMDLDGATAEQLRPVARDLMNSEAALDDVIHHCDMRAVFNSCYQVGFGATGIINGVQALLALAAGYLYSYTAMLAWGLQWGGTALQVVGTIPAGVVDKVKEQDIMAKYVARHVAYRYKNDFNGSPEGPDDERITEVVDYTTQHFRNSVTTARGAVGEPIKLDMEVIVSDVAKSINMDPKSVSVILAFRNYDGETLPAPVIKYLTDRLDRACKADPTLQTLENIDELIASRASDVDAFNKFLVNEDDPTIDASAGAAEQSIDQLARGFQAALQTECDTFNTRVNALSANAETTGRSVEWDKLRGNLDKFDAAFTDLRQIGDGTYSQSSEYYRERLAVELEIPNLTTGKLWFAKELWRAGTFKPEYRRAYRQAWARIQTPREFVTAIGASFWAFWQLGVGGLNWSVVSNGGARVIKQGWSAAKHQPFPIETAKKIAGALTGLQFAVHATLVLGSYLIASAVPGFKMTKLVITNLLSGAKGSVPMGMYINLLVYLRDFQRDEGGSTLPGTGFSETGFRKNFWGNELASTIWKGIAVMLQEPMYGVQVRRAYPEAHQRLEDVRNDLTTVLNRLEALEGRVTSAEDDDTGDNRPSRTAPVMRGALESPEDVAKRSKAGEEEAPVAKTDTDTPPVGESSAKAAEEPPLTEEVQDVERPLSRGEDDVSPVPRDMEAEVDTEVPVAETSDDAIREPVTPPVRETPSRASEELPRIEDVQDAERPSSRGQEDIAPVLRDVEAETPVAEASDDATRDLVTPPVGETSARASEELPRVEDVQDAERPLSRGQEDIAPVPRDLEPETPVAEASDDATRDLVTPPVREPSTRTSEERRRIEDALNTPLPWTGFDDIAPQPKGKEREVSVAEASDDAPRVRPFRPARTTFARPSDDRSGIEQARNDGVRPLPTTFEGLNLSPLADLERQLRELMAGADNAAVIPGTAPADRGARRQEQDDRIERASVATSVEAAPPAAGISPRASGGSRDAEGEQGKSSSRGRSFRRLLGLRSSKSAQAGDAKEQKGAPVPDPGAGPSSRPGRIRSSRFGSILRSGTFRRSDRSQPAPAPSGVLASGALPAPASAVAYGAAFHGLPPLNLDMDNLLADLNPIEE